MSTPTLTLTDFDGKFASIKTYVTPEVLNLINRSETLKEQIRSYQFDAKTGAVALDLTQPDAASYQVPTATENGVATFGINIVSNPIAFIKTVSHELGHYAVEGFDGVLGNARSVAYANRDMPAYENACHLTEGMARLNTAKVIEEITAGPGLSEPLASWFPLVRDFVEYQGLHALLGETQLTPVEAERAIALALGESNKSATTSTSGGTVTYLVYCSATANTVINSGNSALLDPSPASLLKSQVDEAGLETQSIGILDANGDLSITYRETELANQWIEQAFDTNADGLLDNRELISADGGTNPLATLQDIQSAERILADLYDLNLLDTGYFQDFTQWSSDALVYGGSQLWTLGPDFNLSLDPIGAFYESRSPATDAAPGIADKTPVLLDAANAGLTIAALTGLDANADGKLNGSELSGLTLWSDLSENGVLDAGELLSPIDGGIAEIGSADYGFYTAGNSRFATGADTTPDSNYRTLRDTDNTYYYVPEGGGLGWINWSSSQIKINYSAQTYLIGTDGNDVFFDAAYYAAYPQYFNVSLLTNFLGGNGDDKVGGSVRNDRIWGGSGNDWMVGYAGDDKMYGEEDNDILQGQDGQDILDGGVGIDKLFGGAGSDILNGGEGNDILFGFTASDDPKQSLAAGEADNDRLLGGAGNDLLLAGVGDDMLWGEAGDDRLFGQVGDDVLYGGEGNDILLGFTPSDDPKQSLAAGETDNDHLYGGTGNDTLLGGLGNDYLDGGAGADIMEGGAGDDRYVVNSVNDSILEQPGEGHDAVTSSVNYLLNANIEDLRLLDGLEINGTGNALDNRIVGNSRDNILDGVTGADTLIGGGGDDTYYVDNVGDQTVEQVGEGADTVQSTISHTLGAHLENLILLDFTKPEHGLVDGQPILVYGYPKANELDYMQGDAVPEFQGTCALTSIANLLTQAGTPTAEGAVVQRAIENGWTVTDPTMTAYERGGSNFTQQQQVLDSFGLRNDLLMGYNPDGVANLIRSGRGVIIGVNGGALWDDAGYVDDGGANHVVTVTGVAYGASDGALMGFYIADSGRHRVSDMTWFIGIEKFQQVAQVGNAYAIYTLEPLKMWNENIDGHGNELDNVIVGNRGGNLLSGEGGSDTLDGGMGDDTYAFALGSGADTIVDASGTDQLAFGTGILASSVTASRTGSQVTLAVSATDSISFAETAPGQYAVETVSFADGTVWQAADIRQMVNLAPTGIVGVGGTAIQGQTLTASNTLADADGLGTVDYQWQSSTDGGTWAAIAGATANTFTLTQAQVGQLVRANASYTDDHGTIESVASSPSAVVTGYQVGTSNNDTLFGTAYSDSLLGLGGNDALVGHAGDDTLSGGVGNDNLNGGLGSDTYVFDRGDGADQVVDESITYTYVPDGEGGYTEVAGYTNAGQDVLQLGAGIALSDLEVEKSGANLVIGLRDTGSTGADVLALGDRITLTNWDDAARRVETIRLADGTLIDPAAWKVGTTGNDSLNGTAGSDRLYGGAGADTLSGGTGADFLSGGIGNDSYVVDDIGDVVVEVANAGTDAVQSSVSFALAANLENLTLTGSAAINATGNSGANVLTGNVGTNVLTGGAGNDNLNGGLGNDTYVFNRGDGLDRAIDGVPTIAYYSDGQGGSIAVPVYLSDGGQDVLQLGTGITLSDLEFEIALGAFQGDLVLGVRNGEPAGADMQTLTDRINLGNWGSWESRVETLRFADGTSFDLGTWRLGVFGNDYLSGTATTDRFYGNDGNDTLSGGLGNDTYVFNRGDDADQVVDENATYAYIPDGEGGYTQVASGYTDAGQDVLQLGAGITLSDLEVEKSGANLVIGLRDTGSAGADVLTLGDRITLTNWDDAARRVETLRLADGTNIDLATWKVGTTGNDSLNGTAGSDRLYGGAGADTLTGAAGADFLSGGVGADTLTGGLGNDTYVFGRGGGSDIVVENDATAGNLDVAQFTAGIATNQLWFRHVNNDLEVSIIGTSDKLTVQGWYSGSACHLEQFRTADNRMLLDSQVETLVQAMAAFAPPSSGQTTLPPNYESALSSVIAANWQ